MNTQPCPACGATNIASAEWCGQCYSKFGVATDEPGAARSTWTCPTCGLQHPATVVECPACGTSLMAIYDRDRRPEAMDVRRAARMFPGAGLIVAGATGTGAMVVVLALIAGVSAIVLAFRSAPAALLLSLVVAGLWVVSALDAGNLLAERRSALVLTPRVLSFVSGGVLAAVLILLISGLRPTP